MIIIKLLIYKLYCFALLVKIHEPMQFTMGALILFYQLSIPALILWLYGFGVNEIAGIETIGWFYIMMLPIPVMAPFIYCDFYHEYFYKIIFQMHKKYKHRYSFAMTLFYFVPLLLMLMGLVFDKKMS